MVLVLSVREKPQLVGSVGSMLLLKRCPPMPLPDLVRARRLALGLSQAELGAIAGMPQQTIQRLEAGGRVNPRLDTIVRLEKALKLKRGTLLE